MNKKLTTLLLAFLIMIIGKSEAVTITQKLGESAISATVNAGEEVTSKFDNRTNYTFKKWEVEKGNVTINTTSKTVTFIMPNEDVVIRANYEEETPTVATCTLTYNANGGSGAPSSQTVTATKDGYTFTISSIKPVKSGYTFAGWSTSSSATTASYSAGESITLSANTTLYAVWKQNTYTLTYNANGGNGAPSRQTGTTLIISSIEPTRDGYIFAGWSNSSSATAASYSAGESITLSANITLYAIWKVEKPTFASNSIWYKGPIDQETITEIEIVDSYTPTGSEIASWNADVGNIGAIKCYIEGTKLTIAGNGTGQIYANADSSYMFGGHWEYGRYTVGNLFNNVISIKGLNLLNTSNVTNMYAMFEGCSSLESLNLGDRFDTSSVTYMEYMFCDCTSLASLNLGDKFDTSSVTGMSGMFAGCSSLANLNLSNFDTSSVTGIYNMFYDCSSLASLDLSNFDTSKVTFMDSIFYGCSSLTNLDVSGFDTSKVTSMHAMFEGCSSLENLNLSNFDISSVTNMGDMFNGCSSLESLDLSNFDTSSVTSMYDMFSGCSSLESLDLSNFDTSSVTGMRKMFRGCSSLTNLNLSSFNTSSVTDMRDMFNGCSSLINLNLSSFNTSKVKYMDFMFKDCSGLKMLDLSNFDTRVVYRYYLPDHYITEFSITDMFSGMTSLNRITLGVNFTFNGDGSGTDDYAAKLPDGKWYKEGTTEYWDNGQPEEGTRTVTTTYVKE